MAKVTMCEYVCDVLMGVVEIAGKQVEVQPFSVDKGLCQSRQEALLIEQAKTMIDSQQ